MIEGHVSYYLAINKFADLEDEEITLSYKGRRRDAIDTVSHMPHFLQNVKDLPSDIDWRTKNVVTPIKNQGTCGSCYTFSAIGAIEGQFALKNKTLVSFSEQNLLDCSFVFGNYGCQGGYAHKCFEYVSFNHGLDTEEQYPYEGYQGFCRYKNNPINLIGYVSIPKGNETALQQAAAIIGPISVGLDTTRYFDSYGGGVLNDITCNQTTMNHEVLVVGYGVENAVDYWLIKNSWGTDWGLSGYVKISRDKNNQCGIATDASYPVMN